MGLKSIGYVDTLIGYLGGAWSPMLLSPLQFLYKLINTADVDDKSDNDNDANLIESPCGTFDGTAYLAVTELTGSETVVSSDGTSTPTVSAGKIDFTAGTCWNLVLSNGSIYPMGEAWGTVNYDTVNGYHGTLTSFTVATHWAGTQDDHHYSMQNGYSLYEHASTADIYVPYSSTGSALTITPQSGYTKTADRAGCLSDGSIHNGATTAIQQEAGAEPTLGDSELYYAQADVLGDELVTEGDFSNGGVAWTADGDSTVNTGVGRVYSPAGAGSNITQPIGMTIGKTYRLTYTVVARVGGIVALNYVPAVNLEITPGTYEVDFVPSNADLRFKRVGTTDISLDDISVKEFFYNAGDPIKVTWADYLAWVSYSDDLTWLKFTSDGTSCRLSDSVIIDIDGDEDKYDLMTAWKGGGACGGGTSPFS